jgi:hypothetical protein
VQPFQQREIFAAQEEVMLVAQGLPLEGVHRQDGIVKGEGVIAFQPALLTLAPLRLICAAKYHVLRR